MYVEGPVPQQAKPGSFNVDAALSIRRDAWCCPDMKLSDESGTEVTLKTRHCLILDPASPRRARACSIVPTHIIVQIGHITLF